MFIVVLAVVKQEAFSEWKSNKNKCEFDFQLAPAIVLKQSSEFFLSFQDYLVHCLPSGS